MPAPDAAQLVDEFTSLALALARKWARSFPSLAIEFESEAGYTLWRFAAGFKDPIHFFAHNARQAINRALARIVQREKRQNPAAFQRPDGDVDPLSLAADDSPPVGSDLELAEILEGLTDEERQAVELHADGESFSAIGVTMGVPGWRVRDTFNVAAGKVSRRFSR